jgi:hypothetical protein
MEEGEEGQETDVSNRLQSLVLNGEAGAVGGSPLPQSQVRISWGVGWGPKTKLLNLRCGQPTSRGPFGRPGLVACKA